jgi:hypothetical protein
MKYEVVVFTTGKTYCSKEFKDKKRAERFYHETIGRYMVNKPEHNCVSIMYENGYRIHMRTIRGEQPLTNVRKHNGVYNVYFVQVPLERPFYCELRYSKLADAKDCAIRMGGHPYCKEFETREDAQAYLDDAEGVTWW